MNLWGSLTNHEIVMYTMEHPPQGLSEARRGMGFFELSVTDPRGGDPSGAAAIIVNEGDGLKKSRIHH